MVLLLIKLTFSSQIKLIELNLDEESKDLCEDKLINLLF